MSVVGYGIDFGTSNSTLAIARDDEDEIEIVQVDELGTMPDLRATLLYLDRDGLSLTGSRAANNFMIRGAARTACRHCDKVNWAGNEPVTSCRQFIPGGGCGDSRLLAGLKFELADPGFHSTHSWGVDYDIELMVAAVLRDLKVVGDRISGAGVTRAVVGHPFVFHGAQGPNYRQRQALALGRLDRAARQAGFDEVVLLPEPQAAALVEDAEQGTVVTTDFGGGTFDVSVIDFDGDPARVIAVEGAAIGGELIDAAMFDNFISPVLGLGSSYRAQSGAVLAIPAHVKGRLHSLSDIKHLMRDPSTAALVRDLRSNGLDVAFLEELLYGGQAFRFFKDVENAKLELSAGRDAVIDLRRIGVRKTVEISVAAFEDVVAPFVEEARQTIHRALEKAGRSPQGVAYAVRTGGSSQLPAFQAMLAATFGADRVMARDPFTTVVKGLAYEAQGRWS